MKQPFDWTAHAAWLVLATGLVISLAACVYLHERALRSATLAFEAQCLELQRFLELRLERHAGPLFGLRAMHGVSGALEADIARDYLDVLELAQRFPAIDGMDHEVSRPGVPVSVRIIYPLDQLAPPPGSGGRALASLTPAEMHEMRASGVLTASASVPADAIAVGDVLLRVRLPLYLSGAMADRSRLSPPAALSESYRGSVGMTVSMAGLVREVLQLRAPVQVHTRIHLVGREGHAWPLASPDAGNLLFDSRSLSSGVPEEASLPGVGNPALSSSARIRVGGTVLALVFAAPASVFVTPTERGLAPLILLGGLLVSLMLFSLLRSLAASQKQLMMSVMERTRDLSAVNRVLEQEVAERNRLEREVFSLNVEERNQFGRELREGLGRELQEIAATLDEFSDDLAGQGVTAREEAQAIGSHVRTAWEQAELLASGLNPVAVVPGSFLAALERLAAETAAAFHVDCRISHDGSLLPQDRALLHNLYRITQQAVTNAVTHGRATRINVEVSCRRTIFRLAIMDNGVGWKYAANGTGAGDGIGLATMRYRCAVLGLSFHAEIAPRLGGAAIIIEQIQTSE